MNDNLTPEQVAEVKQIIREELDTFVTSIANMAHHEARQAKAQEERMTENSMLAISFIFRQWIVDYLQTRQFVKKIACDTMEHVVNDKLRNPDNEEAS
jgi:hypothetical protein